jgi:lauroyl-KDO2-lipid IV(A) myristoyltransferase
MGNQTANLERYRFRLQLLHPRYWLTWLGLGVFFIAAFLPMSAHDWLGARLGNLAARKNKKRFNIVKTNLSLCFPEKKHDEIEQMVMQHFQSQFRSLLHYSILWWRPEFMVRNIIHKTGFDQIEHYLEKGKNIIILLTHNVGLDFAGTSISMDYSSCSPYKVVRNPVIDWKIANGRLRFGRNNDSFLFTREDGLRPLIRETRAGKILIYLADEDLGAGNSIFAPFFGVQKASIPVLGRLAKSCNAVVLPCVSCYEETKQCYSIKLLPAIESIPSGDDEQDTVSMNKAMEQAIRLCPIQYLWTLRYFQTRPAGEASVYE